jgi:DNA-binding response OmpR family regulator
MSTKACILVVDDEPAWREFTQLILTNDGYRVETASALGEALKLLAKEGQDLIVVSADLLTPQEEENMDALVDRCRGKKFVVMSEPYLRTKSLAESRLAFRLGADDWAIKPLGRSTLLELIDNLLGQRRGDTQSA